MRMRLEWFIAPCVASIIGGTDLSVNAQEAPKGKRTLNVVVNHADDEVDAKGIREKVAKELEKSGISEETKARILKDVEEALDKAKAGATKAKKVVEWRVKQAPAEARKAAESAVADIAKQLETQTNSGSFTTQIFASPKGDGYRIGIQCNAMISEDGGEQSEERVGLEVQRVVDDSPAKKAGINEGDVLMTVNGTKIAKITDLTSQLQEAGKEDKEVTIELKRDEKVVTVTVKPSKMKSSDIELENIRLSLPTGGYVVNAEAMKGFQEQMKGFNVQMENFVPPGGVGGTGQVLRRIQNDSSDLAKEITELKSELTEVKKLLKELIDKK